MKIQLFTGFREGMKKFTDMITIIVNTMLLFIVYILGVGITSIITKILGKKLLSMKSNKDSYWTELNLTKKTIDKYYHQF